MKKKLLPFAITASCVLFAIWTSVAAQQPENSAQQAKATKEDLKRANDQRKESERVAKAKAKEDAKRSKQADKDRLERPTQITINAGAERVRALFVARIASDGNTIEEATDYKIVFSKRMTGMRGAFTQALLGNAYSETPKYTATAVLAEIEKGKTLITISDIAITVRMPFGNVNRIDYTKDRKTRGDADSMLLRLKQSVESQEQTPVNQGLTSAYSSPTQSPTASVVLSSEGYNQAGVGLFAQKKYGEAETAFREAVRLDTYNAAFHFNLGTALNAQNKFVEAEKEIELASRLAPNEENYKKSLDVARLNKTSQPPIKNN